jgi:hypothetical protein
MFARVYLPFGASVNGTVVRVVRLNLMERTVLQRTNVYSVGFVLLITVASGAVPPSLELLVLVLALTALMFPVRYYVTSAGIGMNNVFFRSWADFEGYRVERRRVILVAKSGTRNVSLCVVGSHQQELTSALRRYLHPLLQQERRRRKRRVVGVS